MSTEQSVKEFSFMSYFLFFHNSYDRYNSDPLAIKRPDTPYCPPRTTVRSCRGTDQGGQGSGERERTEADDKGKIEKR